MMLDLYMLMLTRLMGYYEAIEQQGKNVATHHHFMTTCN